MNLLSIFSARLRFLACICQVLMLPLAAQDETPELKQARETYERDVEFATRPIRDRYLSKLESLKRLLGSRGDARGAVAVQEEIDRVKSIASIGGIAQFSGVWLVTYSNNVSRRYVIAQGGSVTWNEENGAPVPKRTGQITIRGNDFVLELGQESAFERLTIKADTLTSEYFSPKNTYPGGQAVFRGIGINASAAKK